MATFVEFTGTAKLDRRTKRLVKRLGPSDIAIIDHPNLDRISAEELLESGVRIVVNVSSSSTGDYPNAGPLALVLGGVCLIDAPGAELFEEVKEGEPLVVRGSNVFRNGSRLAAGRARAADELAARPRRAAQPGQRGARGASPRTRCATSARRRRSSRRTCRCRRCRRASATGTPSWSRASAETRRDLQIVGPYIARLQAGAHRRRRRRRHPRRGGLQAGRDRRRHGLGLGQDAPARRGARRPRAIRTAAPPGGSGSTSSACPRPLSRRRGSRRTRPCSSPTTRAPS